MSIERLDIAGANVEIRWKSIKNLHIGVYPPSGNVRVAAPLSLSLDAVKVAVLTRMPWIRRKQAQFARQERQTARSFVSGETHYVFGRPMRLAVSTWDRRTHRITATGSDRLELLVPAGSKAEDRKTWMEDWHRAELRRVAAPRIERWAERIGAAPSNWGIRRMKTKWGSCNPEKGTIWLNLELARKDIAAVDYVILHEIAHFVSPRHDTTFIAVLNHLMPNWRQIRADLNAAPLTD
ncbi:SprT family zinc-dependent metalloprotease [Rhizobium sp. RU33A]|uniref:M48 family metallopeptidase n=1 Tax=Rhizobium sp. RU33A TaxID=1907413 RepID=UPI000970F302|nr:SprT family zinc-dependent metalloprotease [Rhizobium sp. RU33A]